MVLPHLLVASVVEGVLTALVVAYLQRSNVKILETAQERDDTGRTKGLIAALAVDGLAVLAVATPLGLLAPGTAWGEWSTQELGSLGLQSIPAGMAKLAGLWGAPLAGYELTVLGNAPLGYLLSAVVGILVTGVVVWLFSRLLMSGHSKRDDEP